MAVMGPEATPPESNMILSEIVGLKPLDAGFDQFILEPRFDLVGQIEAQMPTNAGEIGISWKQGSDGSCTVCLTKPEAAGCVVRVPEGWSVKEIQLDGKPAGSSEKIGAGKSACITMVK